MNEPPLQTPEQLRAEAFRLLRQSLETEGRSSLELLKEAQQLLRRGERGHQTPGIGDDKAATEGTLKRRGHNAAYGRNQSGKPRMDANERE